MGIPDDRPARRDVAPRRAIGLLPQARLAVYEGAGHGLPATRKDRLNADLPAFLRS